MIRPVVHSVARSVFGGSSSSWKRFVQLYRSRVTAGGGTITDSVDLNSEMRYILNNNLFNKISYLVDNNYGKHIGNPTLKLPLISFSFDDNHIGEYDAYLIFKAKGAGRGTSFINSKYIGGIGYLGQNVLTAAQISEMYADGWDFQSHGYSHGHDYSATNDFIGLTEQQLRNEMEFENAAFLAQGLPIPKHHAYPRYLYDWTTVAPLVAQYRRSMRAGDFVKKNYRILSWWNWGMTQDCYYNDAGDVVDAKALIDTAILTNEPCHIFSHALPTNLAAWLAGLSDVLDYVYSKGLVPNTVSQQYDKVNAERDKLFNVIEGTNDGTLKDLKPLFYFDSGLQTTYQGRIVFNDTLANIGATIADHYVAKGYHVQFWDDADPAALAYYIPNNEAFISAQAVTIDATNNHIIFASNHGLSAGAVFYLTGTTAPGNLSFNTAYYVKTLSGLDRFTVAATSGGAMIDILDAGADVKFSTYGFRDAAIALYTAAHLTPKYVSETLSGFTVSNYNCVGDLKGLGITLLQSTNTVSITLSKNKFTGLIPPEFNYIRNIEHIDLSNNLITGGILNLLDKIDLTYLTLNNNLMDEEIPEDIGNLRGLITLYLNNNLFHGAIPSSIRNLTALTGIRLDYNELTSYTAGTIAPTMTVLIDIRFRNNYLPTSAVNQILIDTVAMVNVSKKAGALYLAGTNMGTPTGDAGDPATGLGAKHYLLNAIEHLGAAGNWTVSTN
jgi:hypothetical protein